MTWPWIPAALLNLPSSTFTPRSSPFRFRKRRRSIADPLLAPEDEITLRHRYSRIGTPAAQRMPLDRSRAKASILKSSGPPGEA